MDVKIVVAKNKHSPGYGVSVTLDGQTVRGGPYRSRRLAFKEAPLVAKQMTKLRGGEPRGWPAASRWLGVPPLSREEEKRLLVACPRIFGELILTALFTGLPARRLVEAVWGDLDLTGNLLRVPGDGAGRRLVPLHPAVKAFLESRFGERGQAVFPGANGEAMTSNECTRIFRAAVRHAGLSVRITDLPRLFARRLAELDVESELIGAILGRKVPVSVALDPEGLVRRMRAAIELLPMPPVLNDE